VRSWHVASKNRYYDPTVKTAADGTFDLKFIRACEQSIQVAPFWLNAPRSLSPAVCRTG
jgi:hypothetical protein